MMDFEAFIIGDACPDFQSLISSDEFALWKSSMKQLGASIESFNLHENYGGHGYYIRNYGIQNATTSYIVFVDNDDVIAKDHFEHYLSEIEGTDYAMVYYNTLVRPSNDQIRYPELRLAGIGHSEIIISTDIARKVPQQTSEYGHDWKFIEGIVNMNLPIKKASSNKTTYYIMSVGPEKHRIDSYID